MAAKKKAKIMVVRIYARDYLRDVPKFIQNAFIDVYNREPAQTRAEWDALYTTFMTRKRI